MCIVSSNVVLFDDDQVVKDRASSIKRLSKLDVLIISDTAWMKLTSEEVTKIRVAVGEGMGLVFVGFMQQS